MTKILKTAQGNFPPAKVESAVKQILVNVSLASLSTLAEDGSPYINTCYFAFDATWRLYIFSDPKTAHSVNLKKNPRCALTVYDSSQPFASDVKGLQLFGSARLLSLIESPHAFGVYSHKFPALHNWASNIEAVFGHLQSRFYEISISHGKILDEPSFGKEVYIKFQID